MPVTIERALKVNAKMGRVQRTVLKVLSTNPKASTQELAEAVYETPGPFELNSILRAIRQLTRRGYRFTKSRKGRPDATGYVYEWSLV